MQQVAPLPLSVIVATKLPWPHVKPCLESLVDQARAVGAEVILADGNGQALPESPDPVLRDVIWLKLGRASSYRLRLLALARSRGEIIAVTEDHCLVHPGWCLPFP